ncbi:hypothetical protein MMC13_000994 [Lambiella insularis]|nr:hypothetical protein [Lambiella insularis]
MDDSLSYLYTFLLKNGRPYGYMRPDVVGAMPWSSYFKVDHQNRTVMFHDPYPLERSSSSGSGINSVLVDARKQKRFQVLEGWRNELYPIAGSEGITMERAGSPLFGIVTFGVHMTAYTKSSDGMKIWVPKRSSTKSTYPAMLDNSVAGGISAGEKPFDSLIREAAEEASLARDTVRHNARACGTVSYFHIRDGRAGGETGLLQPEVQFVYDLELSTDIALKPSDDEVQSFNLCSVEEVQDAMARGDFKPNCALVLLDFFVRHGIFTAENEQHYVEIVSRLHRKLPFPTSLSSMTRA